MGALLRGAMAPLANDVATALGAQALNCDVPHATPSVLMDSRAFETPLEAKVVEDEVVLISPESAVCVALTPDAALRTAEELAKAARAAQLATKTPANDVG